MKFSETKVKHPSGPPTPPRPLTILFADDNQDAVETLAEILRLDHHKVHTAFEGRTALALAQAHRPDIVLLDISMPGGGLEAARAIAQSSPNVRTIMLTVSEREDDEFLVEHEVFTGPECSVTVRHRDTGLRLRAVARACDRFAPGTAVNVSVTSPV